MAKTFSYVEMGVALGVTVFMGLTLFNKPVVLARRYQNLDCNEQAALLNSASKMASDAFGSGIPKSVAIRLDSARNALAACDTNEKPWTIRIFSLNANDAKLDIAKRNIRAAMQELSVKAAKGDTAVKQIVKAPALRIH
ncbi:MAG: hypothetical protein WC861_06160 [Candidatus Micrarchaeia archaeon]|jgi:hypothetical protein